MKSKKMLASVATVLCTVAVFAVDIETALQQTAEQFSTTIKRGTTIAIVGISSESAELSNFMLDDLTMRFVQMKKLTVANRANLDAIKSEMNFQLSGEVSDDSIQQLGAMIGANVVVHGKLISIGNSYSLTMQALDVSSAEVVDMCRFSVVSDETLGSLLKSSGRKVRVKKWSNDLQFRLGYSYGDTGYVSGGGFYIGASNCNLYNINGTFSIGFAESLGGSIGDYAGFALTIGPAVGIAVKDIVKFQFSPGLVIGVWGIFPDDDHHADLNSLVWFSLDCTAKFLPSKFVSPIVGLRYKAAPAYSRIEYLSYNYTEEEYFSTLNAVDLTAGVSLNFGKR